MNGAHPTKPHIVLGPPARIRALGDDETCNIEPVLIDPSDDIPPSTDPVAVSVSSSNNSGVPVGLVAATQMVGAEALPQAVSAEVSQFLGCFCGFFLSVGVGLLARHLALREGGGPRASRQGLTFFGASLAGACAWACRGWLSDKTHSWCGVAACLACCVAARWKKNISKTLIRADIPVIPYVAMQVNPDGWEQVSDDFIGKVHFCNRATGASSWTSPSMPVVVGDYPREVWVVVKDGALSEEIRFPVRNTAGGHCEHISGRQPGVLSGPTWITGDPKQQLGGWFRVTTSGRQPGGVPNKSVATLRYAEMPNGVCLLDIAHGSSDFVGPSETAAGKHLLDSFGLSEGIISELDLLQLWYAGMSQPVRKSHAMALRGFGFRHTVTIGWRDDGNEKFRSTMKRNTRNRHVNPNSENQYGPNN